MITRGEIAGKILRKLHKTAGFQGFYDDAKIDDAIEDCMDFIATRMFRVNEGWQTKLRYFTTVANQTNIPLPPDIVLINAVRYLFAGEYLPLVYRTDERRSQVQATTGLTQYATRYRIIDNQLYFNPPLVEGGTDFIQVEYTSFPKRVQDDQDVLEAQFAKPMSNFIVWRAASQLVSGVGKANPEWERFERQWEGEVQAILETRNTQPVSIQEFDP